MRCKCIWLGNCVCRLLLNESLVKEETLSEGRALLLHPRVTPLASPMLFVLGNDFERANMRSFEVWYDRIKLAKNRSEYERQAKTGRGGSWESFYRHC